MRRFLIVLSLLLVALPVQQVAAQSAYPNRPIRIIVPYTAVGSADFMARIIGQKLTEAWGQQVLVENRGGAGGNLGMEAAQKSAAEGTHW